ncbi:MAG: hypothetical protein AAB074_09965 [Planctomycetota bacterium]
MIRFPLAILPADASEREASGWFVPGAGPDAWLDEMGSWDVPLEKATLRLVPRDPGDLRPCGALVTLPAGRRPQTSPRAEPWACLGGKLWLPCRARLETPISEAEAGKLPGEAMALHPGVGLVAFGEGSARRVADLLAPPEERPSDWSKARPGVPPAPRLLAVEPEDPPRLERIMAEGRGDIGSRKPGELPPAPGEPGALGQAASWMSRKLAEAIDRLAKGAETGPRHERGAKGAESNWVDRLRNWSADKLQKWAAEIQKAREKEIRRLMHLLATDPDAGLKFAIPFGGEGARGIAVPGSSLGPRNVDFSLSRLGGGRPADSWSMDWKTQQELVARYRELAVRELRLGRHRRAAYIFAELLGDFRAAADALTEGRHYREAAVLYREKLKQPMQAAACLEKGGLLLEAISIYDEEGHHETAGDLFAKIERPEDAAAMWRKAVKKHQDRGDALAAGKLLVGKLSADDEALALFESTWPWSHQAGPCLEARFELLGGLGRHDAMRQLLGRFLRESLPSSRAILLARSLAAASAVYPDRSIRSRAADAARVVAGRLLPSADASDAQELLRAVARTAPDDRLLARDIDRFPRRRRAATVLLPPKPRETEWTPILAYQIQLPGDILWETASARRDLLYVAGFGGGGAVLARTPWSETVQTLTWMPAFNYPHILEPGLDATRPVLFAGSPGPRLELMNFPRNDAIPHVTPAGTPPWFPDEVLGAAVADLGTVWVVREHLDRLVAWAYTQQGAISAIYPLPQLEEALPEGESLRTFAPIPSVAQRLNLFAALGPRLARLGRDGAVATVDLPSNILALSAASLPDRSMIAAAFEAGGALVFDGPDLSHVRRFAEDLAEPLLTFTRDGTLIAAGEKEARVFDTSEGRVYEKAVFPVLGGRPVAAVPGPKPNEFALVMPGGEVRVYRIPRK